MSLTSSQTLTGAVNNLVAKRNQFALDGTVTAIQANGILVASVQGRTLTVASTIDHVYRVGDRIWVTKTDRGDYIALGLG